MRSSVTFLVPFLPMLAACQAPSALPRQSADAACDVRLVTDEVTPNRLRDVLYVRDGAGSCSYRLLREGPARSGFVLSKPASGTARLRFEESSVLVEYTPQPGFNGPDPFVVRLVSSDLSRPTVPVQLVDMTVDVRVERN